MTDTNLAVLELEPKPPRGQDQTWLRELEHEVESHPGPNHLLLCRLATTPFSKRDYLTFGLQHHALVGFFTRYMELLLLRAPSSAEKLWLAKVLVNEYGEGSDGLDHTTLYRDFLREAGSRDGMEDRAELCPAVWGFVLEHLRICREEPFLVGLGALGPGHEWSIPRMFSHIIPGLRRAGFSEQGILYFTLHTEQDVDHGDWMTEVLAEMVETEDQQAQVRRGALLSLEARHRFFSGVEREIVAWRQPVSRSSEPSPGTLVDLRRVIASTRGAAS